MPRTPRKTAAATPGKGPQAAPEATQDATDPLADLRSTEPAEGPQAAPVVDDDPEDAERDALTIVGEAVGAGSVCWVGGTGDLVFDSEAASAVVDQAVAELATLGIGQPLATEADQEDQVAVMIAAWHNDTPALGFLHGGGTCGCRYLARTALQIASPVKPRRRRDG